MPSNERVKIILPSAVVVLVVVRWPLPMAPPPRNAKIRIPASPSRPASAPRSLPTISAMSATLRSAPTTSSTPTPGAAATTATTRRRPADFLLALKDTTGDGQADVDPALRPDRADGAAGGTGIALYNGALYAETERQDRALCAAAGRDRAEPASRETVAVRHAAHRRPPDASVRHRREGQPVRRPGLRDQCLPGEEPHAGRRRASIPAPSWRRGRHLALRRQQDRSDFSPAERYATGIRNGEGFAFDAAGRLYRTQHGRDQLSQNWPKLYTVEQGAELPAEELVELKQGGDYGWPECYYDQNQKKLVLAPEYGGDGGKTVGVCAEKQAPVAAFPGHWAPNDLLIYNGTQFPEAYRGGAFIAFHGSWNRAPREQAGYNVVFQPLADGKAAGNYVVFADGFAGAHKDPGRAAFRPSGLAMGPDGALYIGDDVHGRIWRVTYRGDAATAQLAAAPAPAVARPQAARPLPPEGTHPDAGRAAAEPSGAARRDEGPSCAGRPHLPWRGRATAPAADVTAPTPEGPRSVLT